MALRLCCRSALQPEKGKDKRTTRSFLPASCAHVLQIRLNYVVKKNGNKKKTLNRWCRGALSWTMNRREPSP